MPFEPGTARQSLVRLPETRQPLVQRGGVAEIHVPRRESGLGQVEMGIGEPGDGDLIRLETDPLGEWIGAGLEVNLGAGEGDPAIADADRLHPAEAGIARRAWLSGP